MRFRNASAGATFFSLLQQLAVNLRDGNLVLAELSGIAPGQRRGAVTRMKDITDQADSTAGAVKRALRETYLTPYSRRDIYRLSEALRDVAHRLDSVGFAMTSSAFDELPVGVLEMLALLSNQADHTYRMTGRLHAKPDQWEYVDQIDSLHHRAIALQQQVSDAVPSARKGLVYSTAATILGSAFIDASRGFKEVGMVVADIALTES